jgi:phenylalanyl-tRNA synthetase beta chain
VEVQAPDLCPRFVARAFEDVTIAPSPRWLKARLMAAGQRPINNVVDITNYVMLLTGQPVHAFDLDRVAGGRLTVRRGTPGERMHTLDDVERVLDEDTCVIADADGPTSIAGIMGGRRSEVEPGTSRVLMEAASWNGPNVNRTMARLNLRSEAGARFEKGLAPEQAMEAQSVATALMLELTGARLVAGTVDQGGPGPAHATLRLRDARVAGLLGIEVPRAEARRTLEALDFGVADAPGGLDVTVPAFRRNDVTREADVIEEVARLGVLERLPATIPPNRLNRAGRLSAPQNLRRRAEDVLVGQGLREVAGWSFTSRVLLDRLRIPEGDPLRDVIELQNPMSESQAILRPTIIGSLLDVAAHNVAHGMADLALFESAAVYRRRAGGDGADPFGPPADEHHALAVLLHGAPAPRAWTGEGPPPADVFAARAVSRRCSPPCAVEVSYAPAQWPFLHPGRSAEVLAATASGSASSARCTRSSAQLGPAAHRPPAWAIDLGQVIGRAPEVQRYRDLTSYPAVTQDLAVVVAEDVPAARVLEVVRAAGGARLADVSVFDVYRGRQLGRAAGRWPCTAPSGARSHLSDEDVAPCARRSSRGWRASSEGSCVADPAFPSRRAARRPRSSSRAPRAMPARSPRASWPATRGWTSVHVTSRSDVGRRLDDLYPHHRSRSSSPSSTWDAMAPGLDAAIVAYPHGAAAPTVAALRDHGVKVVDLSADFRLRDVGVYEEWYVRIPARARRGRGLRPARALPPYLRGADLVAGPGCFPTAAVLALAPLRPWIEDVVIDAKTGVSGAGRAATDRTHFVAVDENVSAYGVGRHRHTPEIDQELEAPGAATCRSPSSRTCCRSTRASSSPATSRCAPGRTSTPRSPSPRPTRRSRSSSSPRSRRACATCARRTCAASTSPRTRGRARSWSSRRSTTSGRGRRRRRSRA